MRGLATLLCLVLLAGADNSQAGDLFKVGVTTRDFSPPEPYDWRGAKTHALRVSIWYPAAADAREQPQWVGPRLVPFFSAGSAAPDAPAAAPDAPAAGQRWPLILLSHGSGDMASSLAWLGTALAARGFVVAAVNHPGNNALEDYTVEGFSLWWLRASDLSAVINALLDDKILGSQIDRARIGAAGHSLGGYTVLAIAGGISDPDRLATFCRSSEADASCKPPPSDAEMRNKRLARLETDADFRERYSRAALSYRDERVHAVLALAPGPGRIFTEDSLGKILIPVALVSGTADEVVPPKAAAEAFAAAIPQASLKLFARAGHFIFVDTCTTTGAMIFRSLCSDTDGVSRKAVHDATIQLAIDFFAKALR